jgi:hypothetical protein
MDLFQEYKTVFILLTIIVLNVFIGEYNRCESIKEGMGLGGLIKMAKMIPKLIICLGHFGLMILMIILWLVQCAVMWVPLFVLWGLQFVICAITKFLNIPNCFLWYIMEIAGKLFYLPFFWLFQLLDIIIKYLLRLDFSILKIVDKIWWFLDDISHLFYDNGGFHFMHYSDEVIKRCYTCKIGKFPKIPKFPMKFVTKFTKCVGK